MITNNGILQFLTYQHSNASVRKDCFSHLCLCGMCMHKYTNFSNTSNTLKINAVSKVQKYCCKLALTDYINNSVSKTKTSKIHREKSPYSLQSSVPPPADTTLLGSAEQGKAAVVTTVLISCMKILSDKGAQLCAKANSLRHGLDFLSEISWKTKFLEETLTDTSRDHTRVT